jgi:hypothetical protein
MIEAIGINYDLFSKSSLNICFNKLITNLRLLMLINCGFKTARETPEHLLLYTKLEDGVLSQHAIFHWS